MFRTPLMISVLFLLLAASAQAQTVNPIQITNCQGLQNINNNLNGNYVLANDIDCTNFAFQPIALTTPTDAFLGADWMGKGIRS